MTTGFIMLTLIYVISMEFSNGCFSRLMPVEHISLMPESHLSLTNTRQDTHQLVTHYGSANQEFVDVSVCKKERKKKRGGDRRPLPSQYPIIL